MLFDLRVWSAEVRSVVTSLLMPSALKLNARLDVEDRMGYDRHNEYTEYLVHRNRSDIVT